MATQYTPAGATSFADLNAAFPLFAIHSWDQLAVAVRTLRDLDAIPRANRTHDMFAYQETLAILTRHYIAEQAAELRRKPRPDGETLRFLAATAGLAALASTAAFQRPEAFEDELRQVSDATCVPPANLRAALEGRRTLDRDEVGRVIVHFQVPDVFRPLPGLVPRAVRFTVSHRGDTLLILDTRTGRTAAVPVADRSLGLVDCEGYEFRPAVVTRFYCHLLATRLNADVAGTLARHFPDHGADA